MWEPFSESMLPNNAIEDANPYAIPLRLRGRVRVGALSARKGKAEPDVS
jgi:hypothetical protein